MIEGVAWKRFPRPQGEPEPGLPIPAAETPMGWRNQLLRERSVTSRSSDSFGELVGPRADLTLGQVLEDADAFLDDFLGRVPDYNSGGDHG